MFVRFFESSEKLLWLVVFAFLIRYLFRLSLGHPWFALEAEVWDNYVKHGVSKINVNTDCQLVFAAATIAYCAAGKADPSAENLEKGYDPRKLLKPGVEAIKAKVKEKVLLFGSNGKANY